MTVTEHSLGFPVNRTYYASISKTDETQTLDELLGMLLADRTSQNVKIILSCTREEKKSWKTTDIESALTKNPNIKNVAVVYDIQKELHVRSEKITKAKTAAEKLDEYLRVNKMNGTEELSRIATEIEDNLAISYTAPCHSFTLLWLKLKGSTGIKEGTGKDEYTLNLTQFSSGVIALSAVCGRGKCVTGDTLILSKKGFETIGSYDNRIRGFQSLNKELFSANNTFAKSSHFYSEEVNGTIKITNSLGIEIEGTPEHPVLIFTPNCTFEFKKLKDISCDDYVCISRNMNIFPEKSYRFDFIPSVWRSANKVNIPKKMSVKLAKFLGYYIANGSHSGNSIQFSTSNKVIANDYIKTVESLFNIKVCRQIDSRNRPNYRIFSSVIRQFLEYIFNDNLTTARYKIIPNCILQGTKEEQIAFLTTLFDCDGCLCNEQFEFLTSSKQIANSIQNMLLNFGVTTWHRLKKTKGYNWTYHNLVISSIQVDNLFNLVLKNSLKYKYKREKNVNTNKDIIPYITSFLRNKLALSSGGYFCSKNGKKYHSPLPFSLFQKNNNISYTKLERLMALAENSEIPEVKELYDLFKVLSSNNYFFSKITKKEKCDNKKVVYDFSIPSTHQFYSNGYVSHNSTLIENCQPWLRMLTRNGKLQDHFFLKDSCRELMYQDEEGTFYHITIMIDGKNKSGKVKAFAETGKDIGRMEPVTECDGNLDPYEKWVEDTFGSIDLFLRTAFYTKGNTNGVPDISTATKGEKRTLFNSLMGMDKLVAISQIAREKAKEIKAEIEKLEATISDIDYDNELTDNSEAMDACKRRIKSLSEQSSKIKFTLDEIKRQIVPCSEKENELEELEAKLSSLISEIQSCNRKLETVEKWNCISGIYSDWEKLNTDLSALNSTIDSVTKEIMEKSNRRAEYDRKKEEAFKTFTKSELEYEKFKAAVPEKTDDTCPTCGQKLPVGKIKELEERLSRQKKELSELEKHMKEKESVLISATKAVNSYTEEHIKPLESRRENLIALQSELKERIEKTGITDSDTALKAKAETYLEDKVFDRKNVLESERDNIAGRISKLKEEIASIDNSMHEARIRSLEEELSNADTLLSSAKEDLGGLKKERDILERNRKIEERTRAELKEKQHLQSNYEIVEKAFGANGIQALEMEAMAPDVAEVTNSILQSAYGDKFKVSFQTLRLGSKKELIEDFSIMVENTETGSVKPLEWLSGGEGTWIKEALFHAFSVVRMRNTKFSFRTNFLDEADGALDHDSKLRYLKMIEKAHIESGVDKTILITHSQELKDVIEQKIEL